ncbi:MAG: hypothetical protein KGS61_14415 [Verrucomicrobia bacterium]|nr:hypothetical protein [Verrucomicrobiota bacterium]
MSHWSTAVSWPALLLGATLWAGSAWLCLTLWQRSGRRRAVAWLEGLRFLLITLLALTLLRPEYVRRVRRLGKPEIVVLCDASRSMDTRDIAVTNTANRVISRAQWLAQQRQAQLWKPLAAQARVVFEDFAAPPAGTNTARAKVAEGTDLDAALLSVLQQEDNLKAVLLLTDGEWNLGKSPVGTATRFREQNVPIYTVGVGRETPVPDLALESVSAPAYGLFGEDIAIPFKIQNHLPRDVKTTVTLYDGERIETRKEITLPALSDYQDAILWSPHSVGDTLLTLKLPVEPDESLPDNNAQTFRINVRVDKLRVLLVDSLPRWEYRYLRNALARDPGVEMNCLLFLPGLGPGAGRDYLAAFPHTKEALAKFDVVFLGDVGIGDGELSAADAELIRGLVEQQQSGLVLVPGRRGRELTLLNSPLKELFPVVLDANKPEGIPLENEATLVLSSLGRRHLLTRFDADEERNDQIWRQLPGFFWSAAVEKSRPGSEVLAVHSSLRNEWGRLPLLVTRAYGNGKVLFLGTDSAWRWRRGVEDKYHYRFWSQVVRWMAHARHLAEQQGIRLSFSPETPALGDTIFLQATVLNASGFPAEQGPVNGRVVAPSGRSERLEFAPVAGGWGVFKSEFTPEEGGPHKVIVDAPTDGRHLETALLIAQPQREKVGEPVNLEILREVAGISGGAGGTTAALGQLVQQISLLPEPKPIEQRVRLWCDPRWGGALLLVLAIYWTGRKLTGMV